MGYTPTEVYIDNDAKMVKEIRADLQLAKQVKQMREHPNYKLPTPLEHESQIEFALRCASNIVTPPQFEGESYEVECTTIRDGIISLVDEVTKKWEESPFENDLSVIIKGILKKVEDNNGFDFVDSIEHNSLLEYFNNIGLRKAARKQAMSIKLKEYNA